MSAEKRAEWRRLATAPELSIEEARELLRAVPTLLDMVDAALDKHRRIEHREGVLCSNCRDPWPCATAKALGVTE